MNKDLFNDLKDGLTALAAGSGVARVTRFEQDGDTVTRRVYTVENGVETLFHESTHSAKELDATAEEIFRHNR